ncbi:MAG: zinc ribbon domain-containing protein [Myxococcales bacterium]|nr:zinc ribbon domain-containing protein [Myxococcales bacterium]MCB9525944.1 zinc ribbon domain-containing protein [Myxococcales bacterium]
MPLIDCPDCKHPVSDRAAFCPHCGCPSEFFGKAPPEPEPKPAPAPAVQPDFGPFERPTTWVLVTSVCAVLADLIGVGTGDGWLRMELLGVSLAAQIAGYTLLHGRWWDSLPFERRTSDPLPAVIRCLIPGYNLAWFGTAYITLVDDLNAELRRLDLKVQASGNLARLYVFTYYYLLPIVAVLPVLGLDTSPLLHFAIDGLAMGTLVLYLREANKAAAWLRGAARRLGAAPA